MASKLLPVGHSSKSSSDLDVRHSLEILPLELWGIIFANLPSGTDLLTLSRTCPVWSAFLHQKYPWFPLLKILPFLLPYLDEKTLLRLRQLCQPITQVLDGVLHRKRPNLLQTRLVPSAPLSARVQQDLRNRSRFGFRNPSLWRSVYISVRQSYIWHFQLLSCLLKWGKYVDHCKIFLSTEVSHEPLKLLSEILSYLPNLKRLEIKAEEEFAWSSLYFEENLIPPPLPLMEELQLDNLPPILTLKLMSRYSKNDSASSSLRSIRTVSRKFR